MAISGGRRGERERAARAHARTGRALARRFRLPLAMLIGAVAFGTVGYSLMPGWSVIDGFYMTVITLATVGYEEVHHLGTGGRLFTAAVLLVGLGTVFVVLGTFTELVISGDLSAFLREVRVRRRISGLSGHHIICAYGRVGRAAVAEFERAGERVVVLDVDERLGSIMERDGVTHLIADPTEESVLHDVGIDRARGLVCAVDSDATNVYITLMARALNPELMIVARASRRESVDRLLRAGADRVVQPYSLTGRHMAALVLHPSVKDLFDLPGTAAGALRVEEVQVLVGSMLSGRTVAEACPPASDVTVLALRRFGGDVLVPAPLGARLAPGDAIVVFGTVSALEGLER